MVPTPLPYPTRRGANLERARDHNRRLVLGELSTGRTLGRAELARRSSLSTQAVSNIIAELERDGLLEPCGAARGRRGQPAMQYRISPGGGHALGFEVRPGAVFAQLLDLAGATVWSRRVALARADPATVAALLPRLRDEAWAARHAARPRTLGAGVVMPGPFGRTALSGEATDLPGWAEVEAGPVLERALALPVAVENDANAAAMAERLRDPSLRSFAALYFGTGLGLGIVEDGRLVTGARGNAGEIGQIPVPGPHGPVALERVLSRAAVGAHLARHGTSAPDMAALARLHEAGDPALARWIRDAAPALGHALALVENLLDPACTLLCGAMPEPILRALLAAAPPPRSVARGPDGREEPVRIGTCSPMAAARGAAALVLARAFTPALAA